MKKNKVGLVLLIILFIIELFFIIIGGFNIPLILSTILVFFTILDLILDPNAKERRKQEELNLEQNMNAEESAQLLRLKTQKKRGIRFLIISILLMILSFLVFVPSIRESMKESSVTNVFLIVFLSGILVMTISLFMMAQPEIYYGKLKDKQDQMNNDKGGE